MALRARREPAGRRSVAVKGPVAEGAVVVDGDQHLNGQFREPVALFF